jgi:hypothetical protein
VSRVFERDGRLVFFLSQKVAGKTSMFRILVSTADGEVTNEQTLMELSRPKSGSGWAAMFGGISAGFKIAYDAASGNYAVLGEDGFTDNETGALRINLYDAKHQPLWSYSYKKLDEEQKYLELMDGIVKGNSLYLCTHEFTTRSKGKEQSNLVMTEIGTNGMHVRQQKLAIEPELKGFNGVLRYLPASGRIMLVTRRYNGPEKLVFTAISERDFSVVFSKPASVALIDADLKARCGKKRSFKGVMQDWYQTGDGAYTIIFEELTERNISNSHSGSMLGGSTTTTYEAEDIGVLQLDADMMPLKGTVLVKYESSSAPMRVNLRSEPADYSAAFGGTGETLFEHWGSPEFNSADYIHSKSGDYIIVNTNPDNFKESLCDSRKDYSYVSSATTALFTLGDSRQERAYLWGPPESKEKGRTAIIGTADYAPATGDYAVVMVEPNNGKERKMIARMAWVHIP